MTAATDATGSYTMSGMANGTYTVTGITNKPWGGVTATDALVINRSIVGAAPLVGLRLKAADVNGSNTTTSVDALLVARRANGSISTFAAGNWAYEAVPTTVAGGVTTRNIMAICVGDANGSYQPSTALRMDPKIFAVNHGVIGSSDLTVVPVRIDRALALGAMQINMELPVGVRVQNVRSALRHGNFDFHQEGNELRVSWYHVDGAILSENDLLFSMELAGLSALNAADLRFGELSEVASPLAELYPLVGLRLPRVLGADQAVSIFPNPTRDLSQLRLNLNASSEVSLRVLDARGRVVAAETRVLDAGVQSMDIRTESWSGGQYQVEVTIMTGNETRRESLRLNVRK